MSMHKSGLGAGLPSSTLGGLSGCRSVGASSIIEEKLTGVENGGQCDVVPLSLSLFFGTVGLIKEGLGGLKLAGGLNLGLVGGDVASGLGHAGFREDFGLGLGKGYHLRDGDGGLGLGLSHDLGCLAKDGRHACDDELGLGERVAWEGPLLMLCEARRGCRRPLAYPWSLHESWACPSPPRRWWRMILISGGTPIVDDGDATLVNYEAPPILGDGSLIDSPTFVEPIEIHDPMGGQSTLIEHASLQCPSSCIPSDIPYVTSPVDVERMLLDDLTLPIAV
ncbi:hypothetical protein Dimus_022950 [Dionaea muscipula]